MALNPRVNELPVHGGSQSLSHVHFALSASFVVPHCLQGHGDGGFQRSERTGGAPQELNLLKRRGLLPVYLLGTLLWALGLAEWTALGMVTEEDL